MAERKQPVLFIAGTGRSGSTLLDRMLGQTAGVFSAGEVRYLWQNSLIDDHLCGCGNPFSRCELWSSIMADVLDAGGTMTPREIIDIKSSIDRMRFIPSLVFDVMSPRRRRLLERYRGLLESLYRSVRERTQCRLIVDSSKDPSHGFVLATSPDIELHVVHLVRDSRAVAHSWTRRKLDPARRSRSATMPTEAPARSAMMWNVHNSLSSGLRWTAASYRRVRYEDVVADPESVVDEVLAPCGLSGANRRATNGTVELGVQHTISGNPMRFERGPVEVRHDDEWLSAMGSMDKLLVSVLTSPLLWTYGYPVTVAGATRQAAGR